MLQVNAWPAYQYTCLLLLLLVVFLLQRHYNSRQRRGIANRCHHRLEPTRRTQLLPQRATSDFSLNLHESSPRTNTTNWNKPTLAFRTTVDAKIQFNSPIQCFCKYPHQTGLQVFVFVFYFTSDYRNYFTIEITLL